MEIEALIEEVKEYYPQCDPGLIHRAYEVASQAHDGQIRASGQPYVQHSLETAALLADLRLDPATIAAAILHDVPEDTGTPLEKIRQEFGEEVASEVEVEGETVAGAEAVAVEVSTG